MPIAQLKSPEPREGILCGLLSHPTTNKVRVMKPFKLRKESSVCKNLAICVPNLCALIATLRLRVKQPFELRDLCVMLPSSLAFLLDNYRIYSVRTT